MTPKPSISKPPIDSQWQVPLNAMLRGGLRDRIRQFSDGSTNIMVPRNPATSEKTIITPPGALGNVPVTPPPACVPAVAPSISWTPFDSTLSAPGTYTFHATEFGTPPTAPIYFEFLLNGSTQQNSTSSDWVHNLVDGDILDKNEEGLGHIFVTIVARNACNVAGSSREQEIAAQGTP